MNVFMNTDKPIIRDVEGSKLVAPLFTSLSYLSVLKLGPSQSSLAELQKNRLVEKNYIRPKHEPLTREMESKHNSVNGKVEATSSME